MRKSWLCLLFGLSFFALMGADCDTGGNVDKDKDPLPPRALAASPLLRTYYQTQLIPAHMRAIKIPEGDAFHPDHLTFKFDMGGDEQVNEVRARVTVGVNSGTDPANVDLFARVIAPDSTTSEYKKLDLSTGGVYNPQPEVQFLFEFKGQFSTGTWQLQIRDPIKDNDGRCLFRNAVLRINNGEVAALAGQPADTETVNLDAVSGKFGPLKEFTTGTALNADYAVFGVQNMLINTFTFSRSFSVRGFTLDINLVSLAGTAPAQDCFVLMIAPSGGYYGFALPSSATESVTISDGGTKINHYTVAASVASFPDESFPFAGEPSTGVWTLCLCDIKEDQNLMQLVYDTTLFSTSYPTLSLKLDGVDYP